MAMRVACVMAMAVATVSAVPVKTGNVVTVAEGHVTNPAVANLGDGAFVVVWAEAASVQGQVYDENALPIGQRIAFVTNGTDAQATPDVSALGTSPVSFVVQRGGFAQIYNKSGLSVSAPVTLQSSSARVAGLPRGFVAVWSEAGAEHKSIAGMIYSEGGRKEHSFVTGNPGVDNVDPVVSELQSGHFVVLWHGAGYTGQVYDDEAQKVGDLRMSFGYAEDVSRVAVSGMRDGGFVVTWQANEGDLTPAVHGRCFDGRGEALGREFHVADATSPSVSGFEGRAGFVLVWVRATMSKTLYGQVFNSEGAAEDGSFRIAGGKDDGVVNGPSVTSLSGETFVALWVDGPSPDSSIRSQHFSFPLPPTNGPESTRIGVTIGIGTTALALVGLMLVTAIVHHCRHPEKPIRKKGYTKQETYELNEGENP